MGRILLWTVIAFLNVIFLILGGGMLTAFWLGASVYGLMDSIAVELDNREFMYERLGIKDNS